ncbi:hypothetical protein ACTRW9_02495 [Nitrospina sp. 32_T5]|uniref:hypothetical protein n=1 Tax=unclassified Nitrospina TaxID=2638683 RepID=UPI003F9872A1
MSVATRATPEKKARQVIDQLLEQAGWVLQDYRDFDRTASLGVAVREFPLGMNSCDYLLFVDGKATGVIEAKLAGTTLSGVAEQSEKYMSGLPDYLAKWDKYLRFDYESTGNETFFRDTKDPRPHSRRVFAFHKPDIISQHLEYLPPINKTGLLTCQLETLMRGYIKRNKMGFWGNWSGKS